MFYTFAPARSDTHGNLSSRHSSSGTQRRKLPIACERCRLYHIRCEPQTPCPQCVAAKARCKRDRSRAPKRKDPSTSSPERPRPSGTLGPDTSATEPSSESNTPAALPIWSRPTEITSFLESASKLLHQTPQDPLILNQESPISVYMTSSLESSIPPVTSLTVEEVDCLLRVYWQSLDLNMPILDRDAFEAHYRHAFATTSPSAPSSPLADAITALSSQYVNGTNLVRRVLGLRRLRDNYQGDVSLAAFCYLRRCRKSIEGAGTGGSASLATVQIYAFMTQYLLNAGQYETAYTILGLTVRIAHALDLHTDQPESAAIGAPDGERRLRSNLWWALVNLDLKCSFELNRPLAAHGCGSASTFPQIDESDAPAQSQYHVWRSKLSLAVLLVQEFLCRSGLKSGNVLGSLNELEPNWVDPALGPLRDWKSQISATYEFRAVQLDLQFAPSPDMHYMPQWQQRHTILLSLYYHDFLNRLYRSFIDLPPQRDDELRNAKSLAHVRSCSRKCLDHAWMIIDIIYDTMQTSDVLYGCFELKMMLWNAVVSMTAFFAAYPQRMDVKKVLMRLDQALMVFELDERRQAVSRRACELTRTLRARLESGTFDKYPAEAGKDPSRARGAAASPPPEDWGDNTIQSAPGDVAQSTPQEHSPDDPWSSFLDSDMNLWDYSFFSNIFDGDAAHSTSYPMPPSPS